MRWLPVLLAGCTATPAQPTTPPIRPVGECENETADVTVGVVAITTCHVGDTAKTKEEFDSGTNEKLMHADLALRAAAATIKMPLGSWKNGIEWDTHYAIAGTLTDGRGRDLILVHTKVTTPNASQLGMFATTLHGFTIERGAWAEVYTLAANNIDVTVASDHTSATVTSCNLSKATPAPGCQTYDDGEPGPHATLGWDGHRVVTLPDPP